MQPYVINFTIGPRDQRAAGSLHLSYAEALARSSALPAMLSPLRRDIHLQDFKSTQAHLLGHDKERL